MAEAPADEFGRSVFARVAYGTHVSLLTGVVPAALALIVGSAIGLLAGYFRGRLDGLSFLGLGVQPPTSDWGEMLARGRRFLPDATWLMVFPGLAVSHGAGLQPSW